MGTSSHERTNLNVVNGLLLRFISRSDWAV
jgi:hypothetical protein